MVCMNSLKPAASNNSQSVRMECIAGQTPFVRSEEQHEGALPAESMQTATNMWHRARNYHNICPSMALASPAKPINHAPYYSET